MTYRLADHTTADDASRYRSDEEVSRQWRLDPVARLRAHLVLTMGWQPDEEEQLLSECRDVIDAAADTYLATAVAEPTDMFDYLYATLPEPLRPQREELTASVAAADRRFRDG
jgi:pyruvate dehydrogenase E1 component alpha subunit